MKRFLKVFGFVLFAVLLGIAGFNTYMWKQASQYEETALPYVKAVVPELTTWDTDVIKSYMAEEIVRKTTDENFVKIIEYLSRMGKLIKAEEPSFAAVNTGAGVDGINKTYISYNIDAVFEKGEGVINIVLLDKGDSFEIQKFHISSLALAAQPPGE